MELNAATSGESVSVSDAVFARAFNQPLVHQVVTAYLAGGRAGTKAQKNRAARRGGGKKAWRQKGTGRARAGTIRSPLWVGGGVTFAASPRDYAHKINRKMYRAGISAILSELVRQQRLTVIAALALDKRSTQGLIGALADQDCAPSGVLVVDTLDDALVYSANNIAALEVIDTRAINPVVLVGAERVMVTEDALRALEGWLA